MSRWVLIGLACAMPLVAAAQPDSTASALEDSAAESGEHAAEGTEERSAGTNASHMRELATTLAEAIADVDARQRGFTLTLEAGASILTPLVDFSARSFTFDFALRAGYHIPDFAFLVSAESSRWRAPELGGRTWQTALNIGFGFARYHRSGLLRTMVMVGPSILVANNDLDPAGSVGLYLDIRPLGFSWRFSDRWALTADLLQMTLVAPVLTGVPLIDFQFRSSLGIEAAF